MPLETPPPRPLLVVVEDDDLEQRVIGRVLSKLDPVPQALFASDGESALRVLGLDSHANGSTSHPHLILLDIKMPLLSGLEVLEIARKHERLDEVRIIMLTSSDDPDDVEKAKSLGANGFVIKALDLIEFDQVLRKVVLYCLGQSDDRPMSPYCLFLT